MGEKAESEWQEHGEELSRYENIQSENEVLKKQILDLKKNIEIRYWELATLTRLLEARNQERDRAVLACLSLEGKLEKLHKSLSWKITAPIRRGVSFFNFDKQHLSSGTQQLQRIVEESGYFDEIWYSRHHPEVINSNLSPIQYFIEYGLWKWHDPGPSFSCDRYISKYSDVAIAGTPPFLHFLRHGKQEGRDSE